MFILAQRELAPGKGSETEGKMDQAERTRPCGPITFVAAWLVQPVHCSSGRFERSGWKG